MKKFMIFLLVLLVIGVGAYFMTPSLESIVQKVVHKYGSQVTGTEVNLGGFRLNILNGEVEVKDLTVANPQNYSQPNIMSVGRVAVKINVKSLLEKTIVIENVEIEKPEVTYELLSITQNNLSQLMENIRKNTASADQQPEASETKPEVKEESQTEAKEGKKVVVNQLSVSGGNINLAASLAGRSAAASIPLPEIRMQDIGKEKNNNGATIVDTLSTVLQKIFSTAYDTVVSSKLVDLKGAAEESLNAVVDSVKEKSGLKNWFGFGK